MMLSARRELRPQERRRRARKNALSTRHWHPFRSHRPDAKSKRSSGDATAAAAAPVPLNNRRKRTGQTPASPGLALSVRDAIQNATCPIAAAEASTSAADGRARRRS